MNKFLEIFPKKAFSYSSLNAFLTCKYYFKLRYVDKIETNDQNFFAEFGTAIHKVMESFFLGESEIFELSSLFMKEFSKISTEPPPYPMGMKLKYYDAALEFFRTIEFELDEYELISSENSYEIKFSIAEKEIKFVAKPDLILHHKKTGKYILYDFKTSTYTKNKTDDYKTQLLLYVYAVSKFDIEIDEVYIWYIRANKLVEIKITPELIKEVIDWVNDTSILINEELEKQENSFEPTIDDYFCKNICSVRSACKYIKET